MKTIAITIWDSIISPLYDSSSVLLIIKPDLLRHTIDIHNFSLIDKLNIINNEQIEVIICGAISENALKMLLENGIEVKPWVCGPVEKIVSDYIDNKNVSDVYAMPGCRHGHCGRHRRKYNNQCSCLTDAPSDQ